MDVKLTQDAVSWDQALTRVAYPPFTQAWSWGKVQEAGGKRVVRLMAETAHGPILAQWIEERRGPLSYWYAPQGPVLPAGVSVEDLNAFLRACQSFFSEAWRICFLRIEPKWRQSHDILSLRQALDWPGKRRVHALNPSTSYVLPLKPPFQDVFESFHKKTRYNIRLAERHHIVVRGGTEKDLPIFLRLMNETAKRDGFQPHSETYLRTVYQVLHEAGVGRLRLAEHMGQVLAVNFEVVCGDTVTYLYGASSSEERERMAPYALQWSAIFAAIQDGLRWYDFGGGNPVDETAFDFVPKWDGISRFKERWATLRITDAGTWDVPCRTLLYKLLVRR